MQPAAGSAARVALQCQCKVAHSPQFTRRVVWETKHDERPLSVTRVLFCCLPMLCCAAVPSLPSCFLQLGACLCVCVRACARWWTTVYELALLFNLGQFHLKLSSVRLLARSANINSSSTATTHTRRRPHNTFATVVRRCFCFSRFVLLIFSPQIYQNLESCNKVRARQTPLKEGEESN